MTTLHRTLLNSAALASLVLCSFGPLHSYQQDADVTLQGRRALDAAEQGRHEDAYKIWSELVSKGPAVLGEDIYTFSRSQIYMAAYKKIAELGENCTMALQWTEKGKAPGPPDYKNPADGFYPLLLLAEGVCHAQQERYEQAYTQLNLAKAELKKVPDEDMTHLLRQADHYLSTVKKHVISEDDYVTNKGVLQLWIAKVRKRQGDTLDGVITYANKDLGATFQKGQTVEILLSECKELGAISADAALKGWQ